MNERNEENSCRKTGPQKISSPNDPTNIFFDNPNIGSGNGQIHDISPNKILITRDELALKGYYHVRQGILRKSKDDDIYLQILKYADIVLDRIIESNLFPFYKKTFIRKTKQLKIIDLFEGKNYITKEDEFFESVKKYREYYALTYEIRCNKQFPDARYQNRGYVGYTRFTEDIRLINHTIEAVE